MVLLIRSSLHPWWQVGVVHPHSAAAAKPWCFAGAAPERPHQPLQQSQRAAGSLSALEALTVGQVSGESDGGGRVQPGIHRVVRQTPAMDRRLQEEEVSLSHTGPPVTE